MNELDFRNDADAASDAIAGLLPDAAIRKATAELIAESIRSAHAQAPASWELTSWLNAMRPNVGKIAMRLNVGPVAVLEVYSDDVVLYTVAGTPPKNRQYERIESNVYRAVKESTERWAVPLEQVASLEAGLWERHLALVRSAAQVKRVSTWRRHHSPGAVVAIGRLIGDTLPQPAYVEELEPRPPVTVPDSELPDAPFGSSEANRVVEQAAVQLATARLCADGWQVRSVEQDRCGYDLHCERRGEELHVEVKGVQGEPSRFVITAGEVRQAKADHCFALILVGQALSAEPTFERWSGSDFLRAFVLEPLQYVARRSGT